MGLQVAKSFLFIYFSGGNFENHNGRRVWSFRAIPRSGPGRVVLFFLLLLVVIDLLLLQLRTVCRRRHGHQQAAQHPCLWH